MLVTNKVFFVFTNQQLNLLAADPSLLLAVDCVISCLPGVSLDQLGNDIVRMTFEEALDSFEISRRNISLLASVYSLSLLDKEVMSEVLPVLDKRADESIRLGLLNYVAVLTYNTFALELLFDSLVKNGLASVSVFQFSGRYRLIERFEIRTLLNVELGLGPHLEYLCAKAGLMLSKVGSGDRLGPVKNALRDLLLLGYKGKTLFQRSLRVRRPSRMGACDAAVVIRARTELLAAEPILRERAKGGYRDLMLVDDLIKSPDGTSSASSGLRAWLPLHAFSKPTEVAYIFLRCISLRWKAARWGMAVKPNRISDLYFLGRKDVATRVLHTAFASVPELLVHRIQLDRALSQLTPNTLVSFDQVDRWGAVQGELARQRGVHSIMVQNTAIDDMVFPLPLATDHLVVASDYLSDVFIASGADPKRVYAFGLPIYDDVIQAGEMRLQNHYQRASCQPPLPLRVLIATQPFVEIYDYNKALLSDFETAINGLDFAVQWFIKPHPREPSDNYGIYCSALLARGHDVKIFEGSFEAALLEADIVLSRVSTGLEFAALGGVPGIAHLNRYPKEIINELHYLKSPVTAKSFDILELRAIIEEYAPEKRLGAFRHYFELRSIYLHQIFPAGRVATGRLLELMARGLSSC